MLQASKVESTKSQDTTIPETVIEHSPNNDTAPRLETTPSTPLNTDNVDMDEDDEDISITEGSDDDQEVPDIHFTEEQEDVEVKKEEEEEKIDTMDEKDVIAETTEERDSTPEKEEVFSSKTDDNSIEDHTTTLKEEEDPHPIATATIPLDPDEPKEVDIKMEESEIMDQHQDDSETVSSLE